MSLLQTIDTEKVQDSLVAGYQTNAKNHKQILRKYNC